MIEDHWKRIAGMHVTEVGDVAFVWIAYEKLTDTITLYECAMFRAQQPAVIAEGVNSRGRWIPLAFRKEDQPMADMLRDRGANTIEAAVVNPPLLEIWSREIRERMNTGRFKVVRRLAEWLDESKTYFRDDAAVPKDSHPLMTATIVAVMQRRDWARALRPKGKAKQANYPKMAIV